MKSANLSKRAATKETDHSLRLLEGLNQSVQKDTVKTAAGQFDAILMMFVEGVHRLLLCGQIPGAYALDTSTTSTTAQSGYQGRALA